MIDQLLQLALALVAASPCGSSVSDQEASPAPRAPAARGESGIETQAEPRRQFDFWIGEWDVLNRRLSPEGTWVDSGRARARIVPVLAGAAIFEEWSGELGGAPMYGCSLRAFDENSGDWILLLNWPGGTGVGSFGTLRGSFRHGRGEFFAGVGQQRTRYTFSDCLPDSVRWDSATTADGGQSWRTSWIMEFSRTRASSELDGSEPFGELWSSERTALAREALVLSFAHGSWVGVERRLLDGEWSERSARLEVAPIIRGHALVERLELGPPEAVESSAFGLLGWDGMRRTWSVWDSTAEQPVPVRSDGDFANGGVTFVDEAGLRTSWTMTPGKQLSIETRAPRGAAGELELVRSLLFDPASGDPDREQ